MTLGAAYALCPELVIRQRDAIEETATLKRLAETALDFTPWVSLDRPQCLLLEIRASLKLFGGAEALRENLRQRLAGQGNQPVIAITPSPEASALLARIGLEAMVTERPALRSALSRVPLNALALDDKTTLRLARTGIHRLADLWRLPRDGLARRYGGALLRQLDSLAGWQSQPLNQFHCPPRFAASREMPIELERLDDFFPAIAQLTEAFAAFLKARDAAALGLTLSLGHTTRPATQLELRFRSTRRNAAHWLGLLREKLERSPLPAPVIAITLSSTAIAPFEPEREDLFATPQSTTGQGWQATLEQLQARLGPHALTELAINDDYRPGRALHDRVLGSGNSHRNGGKAIYPTITLARPLWLLNEPIGLDSDQVELLAEPERIESGWWDGNAIRRDYFPARDRQGRKLWVFRDLNSTRGWYLHGLFG
jgi:protein ImuB